MKVTSWFWTFGKTVPAPRVLLRCVRATVQTHRSFPAVWKLWLLFLPFRPWMERAEMCTHGTPFPVFPSGAAEHTSAYEWKKPKMKPWTRRCLCLRSASAVILGAVLGRSVPLPCFTHLPVQSQCSSGGQADWEV